MNWKEQTNKVKIAVDTFIDPLLMLSGYNLAILETTYQLIQSNNAPEVVLGQIIGGTGLTYGNKFLLAGTSKITSPITKIVNAHIKTLKQNKGADWKNWLKTAILTGSLLIGMSQSKLVSALINEYKVKEQPTTSQVQTIIQESSISLDNIILNDKRITIPKGSLYSLYAGIDSTIIEGELIPPNKEVLKQLWQKKFRKFPPNETIKKFYSTNILSFEDDNQRMSLDNYLTNVDEQLLAIKQNFAYKQLLGTYIYGNNHSKKLFVFKKLSERITSKNLVSIALKELMPSNNSEYNVEFLSWLLNNRGKTFLDNIPSLNDSLLSIDLYQLTEHAISDNGNKTNGASRFNEFLPLHLRIPKNISDLKGWDHERATYLNLLNAIAYSLSNTNSQTLNYLSKINDEDFQVMLGGLHHRSRDTQRAISYWSANNAKFPLIKSMNKRLTKYNLQVKKNSEFLQIR